MTCINTNSSEFQTLKQKSGISDFELKAMCGLYMSKYGRFPHLDELKNSNSLKYLSSKLNQYNGIKTSELLDFTGTETVEEAVIKLNNELRDLEISATDFEGTSVVRAKYRPKINNEDSKEIELGSINSRVYISKQLERMRKLYGIKINQIRSEDLKKMDLIECNGVKAFIHNGEIYVNVDCASVDAPIHEMLHIFMGGMKFTNPKLYQTIISKVSSFGVKYHSIYQNRTQNDLNEEVLVSELAKYLTGLDTELSKLPEATLYEIEYEVMRNLDTILMGYDSVKTLSKDVLYNSSLRQLGSFLGAENMKHDFVSNAKLSREVANVKQTLMEQGKLEEICSI